MSLSCGCDFDEGQSWHRTRTARKRHTCFECNSHIDPGDDYEFHKYAIDGFITSFKVCSSCNDLGESMMAMGFCWTFGELIEMHAEYLDYYAPPVMAHYPRGGAV